MSRNKKVSGLPGHTSTKQCWQVLLLSFPLKIGNHGREHTIRPGSLPSAFPFASNRVATLVLCGQFGRLHRAMKGERQRRLRAKLGHSQKRQLACFPATLRLPLGSNCQALFLYSFEFALLLPTSLKLSSSSLRDPTSTLSICPFPSLWPFPYFPQNCAYSALSTNFASFGNHLGRKWLASHSSSGRLDR